MNSIGNGIRVGLFVTCLVDQLWSAVGTSTVEVLRRAGCSVEFDELGNADACCGLGGTFSVKYPEISAAILDQKIEAIERAGVDAVISGDASCLMQIGGRLSRIGSKVRVMHLAELLASK